MTHECYSVVDRVGITITDELIAEAVAYMSAANGNETGGILIGRYSDRLDAAIVTRITGPTSDSVSKPRTFDRGVTDLADLLKVVWDEGFYYLGEWHTHPGGNGVPSELDNQAMHEIAELASYKCPQPILMILSGDPKAAAMISCYVYGVDTRVHLSPDCVLRNANRIGVMPVHGKVYR